MLNVDSVTIFICLVLLVLALMSCICDSFFHAMPKRGKRTLEDFPVTVIVVAENNAAELRTNLESILSQDYPAGYEVIVAVAKDEDGTSDYLKTLTSYKNLRVTYVPDSALYMSRRKLAITLGVKASQNEWILLVDATSRPLSPRWIYTMTLSCDIGRSMVLGYSNYTSKATQFQRFLRLHCDYRNMREASTGGYGLAGTNLMFRKDIFLEGKGFQGNLKYIRGEYDFLVNKYARRGAVSISTEPESFIEEIAPTEKEWFAYNILYMETREHMFRCAPHRTNFNLDMLSLHLSLWLSFILMIYSLATLRWIAVLVAIITLVGPLFIRVINAHNVFTQFDLKIPSWRGVMYEAYFVVHNVKFMVKHILADKAEFISHKF
ncbi:MAG: glycosyltransferase, partial [Prevotella sp.]|nr:glycosyltransferase [Prevotella sp.]